MSNEFDILTGFSGADLMKKMPQSSVQKNYNDTRFWKLAKNKEGSGAAVIRLVTDKNKVPFVQLYHYGSKKTIGDKTFWLIANSPSSIGLPCPIQEEYFDVLNSGDEKTAKDFYSRKVKYYTNIMVIKDPANPQNEGKIFLFEFGNKLKEKFMSWMNPDETQRSLGRQEKELYNPINGYNIELSIKKDPSSGFYNYDSTTLDVSPTKLGNLKDNKDIVDVIVNKTYDLSEFTSPDYFETYDELKAKLERFKNPFNSNRQSSVPSAVEKNTKDDDSFVEVSPKEVEQPKQTTKKEKVKVEAKSDDEDWLNDIMD